MTVQDAFTQQFIKQGMAYGLTQVQASNLFKKAAEKHAIDWQAQLQGLVDSASNYAQQNPTAAGSIAGGLGGATTGAMVGGPNNRMKGALGGGLAGAGIGGAAGLSLDPAMQQKLMQMLKGDDGTGATTGRYQDDMYKRFQSSLKE